MIDNGSILILIVLSFVFGRNSIALGFAVGVAIGIILFFVIHDFVLMKFITEMVWSIILSIAASVLGRIILPGLKGGGHNSGPTYIGGGEKFTGIAGGIILTDEERKNIRDNERKIP